MANPDFKKVVIRNAILSWPKLDQPYRYNSQAKKSEACAPSASGASYSVGITLSAEEAKALYGDLKAHFDDCKTRNSKLKDMSKVFGMKPSEDRTTVTFNAKKRAMSAKGEVNQPPQMVDGMKRPIEDRRLFSGSVGNIIAVAYPVTDPDGNDGISLLLDKIQVTKAVYGDDNSDFDEVGPTEMINNVGAANQDDPFGLPPIKEQQSQAMNNDLDDEIPFN